jgi:phosphoketolase
VVARETAVTSADGEQKQPRARGPLSAQELDRIDAYWRAANYLSVGQIYLLDNPCCESRCASSTSSRACSGTGARRPGSTSSTRTSIARSWPTIST